MCAVLWVRPRPVLVAGWLRAAPSCVSLRSAMGCGGSSELQAGAPRPRPEEPDQPEEAAARASRRETREKSLVAASTLSGVDLRHTQSRAQSVACTNINSQTFFSNSDQTIIIFDWDDTLCPSTACKRLAKFDRSGRPMSKIDGAVRESLLQLQDQVIPLLQLASQLGKVVLVTNARRPWVDISCKAFLPAIHEMMKQIPTLYAVEMLEAELAKENKLQGMTSDMLLTETKTRSMKAAITQFYSRYPNQSWKNIVSVGDALFEHNAVRQVVAERLRATEKKCRTKTIKLLDGPTTSGLMIQVSIVSNWLRKIVEADYDVDIDFSADEATVNMWVAEFSETVGLQPG